jgi:hypothetical protein
MIAASVGAELCCDSRWVLTEKRIDKLIRRIRAEYLEMPGLRLTPAQAQRLWGLTTRRCDALMRALMNARFLRRTRDGSYILFDANSPSPSTERRPDRAPAGGGTAAELVLGPAALSSR